MRQLFTKALLVAACLSATFGMSAATVTVGDFTYTTSGKKAVLTKGPTTGDVVIPETIEDGGTTYTVSEIKSKAFQKTQITSVKIPGTVTKIGTNAFEECPQLASVEFGEGVQQIGSYAFKNCAAIKSLEFPSTLTNISSYAFDGLTLITSVVIPDKVNMLMSYPFQNCTSLRSITVGAKLNSFNAANVCKNCPLEEILVSEAHTRLASVDGVLYDKKGADLKAYPPYKKTETFTPPSTVTRISDSFKGAMFLKHFVGNDALTTMPNQGFQECPELESVTLGKSVSSIGARSFYKSPKMTKITISDENPNLKAADGVVMSKDGTILYMRLTTLEGTSYAIPEGVTQIERSAFYYNEKLADVTFPSTLTSIGASAFARCSALKTAILPASVKEIGSGAFSYCKNITEGNAPEGVTEIQEETYYGCSKMTKFSFPSTLTTIGYNAFYNSGLIEVTLPEAIDSIAEQAFYTAYDLDYVTIGSSIRTIGANAFRSYPGAEIKAAIFIKAVTPPSIGADDNTAPFEEGALIQVEENALEAYKADANYARYKLEARLPLSEKDVTLTAPGTLADVIQTREISSVVGLRINGEINGADFDYINRMHLLRDIDLSGATIVAGGTATVTEPNTLPKHSVKQLSRLQSVKLPDNLTAIADSALVAPDEFFGDKLLKTIDIPASVETIGKYAFAARYGIKAMKLPEKLAYLGEGAFNSCDSLEAIEIPASIDTIHESTFNGCRSLADLKLNEGLKVIEGYAFQSCAKIESLTVPNSVDSIGNSAFAFLKSLTYVKLPDNLKRLNNYTFWSCPLLEEMQLPESITYIGASCFSSCTKLAKINIPENVTEIGQSVFSLDSALKRIDIPRYVSKVGAGAFDRCKAMTVATVAYDYEVPGESPVSPADPERLPSKLQIGYSAFSGCSSLEAIYFGSTTRFLGENALAGLSSLKKIFVAATTPPGMYNDEMAFDSYDAILYVPQMSIFTYMTDPNWKYFKDIRPLEDNYSALEGIIDDADVNIVSVVNGTISFADPSARVSVTNLSGQLIYSGKAADVSVAPGPYIISVNSKVMKLMVK